MASTPKYEIETQAGRKRAQRHFDWIDHGFLRYRWHNFAQFSDGAYRSNHPTHVRFDEYANMGINSVLNLRAPNDHPPYLFEVENCERLGLSLITAQMAARSAPSIEVLERLFAAFDQIEKPFLMHCKSGADRTGLAAALYLLHYENQTLDVAKRQLSFDYVHIKRSGTGVLDHFLELYGEAHAVSGIGVLEWIRTAYDPEVLTKSFAAKQKSLWPWQGWR